MKRQKPRTPKDAATFWACMAAGAITAACNRNPSRSGDSPEAYARSVYQLRCAACHGESGQGVARTGVPMPNFANPDWQATRTDEEIESIIAKGGKAVGKSQVMPANPDLAAAPPTLKAMRQKIRDFSNKAVPR